MSNDARPNGTIQRPHQRSIQHNWFLKFHNIRRSAPCRALEEQFHLPALLVDLGDGQCRKHEVVGKKLQTLVGFSIAAAHPPERIWVHRRRLEGRQNHGLVRADAGALVHRMRVAPLSNTFDLVCTTKKAELSVSRNNRSKSTQPRSMT